MDKIFKKYRKRLSVFALFKSILLALAIAFIVMGISSSITWASKASIVVILSLACGLGGLTFLSLVFPLYFKHFRPTNEMVAKRLDALGFDERYITMYECKDDTSFMAKLQREDAKKSLSKVPAKCLKFSVAISAVIMLAFGALFAAGTTTGAILFAVNSSSSDIDNPPVDEKEYFTVTYKVFEEGTGTIEGQLIQTVEKGQFTTPVTAIAAAGYRFAGWVNEEKDFLANQNNPRAELNVRENMTIFALFEEKKSPDDDDDNPNGGEGEGGDVEKPEPGGDDSDNPGTGGGSQGGGGESGPGGGEGESRENNKVIDGTVDYKENFDREKMEEELLKKDIPDELKDILGDYYGTLKP